MSWRRDFDAARDPYTARNALGITTTGGSGGGFITAVTPPLQVTGTTLSIDLSAYLTTAAAAGSYQPLDADLTALAALTGTNVIYYRSAANTWSAVTVGTGLAFSGGNLTATGGGGTPGGSNTQVQYNNSGAFGGSDKFIWDGTALTLGGTTATAQVGRIDLKGSTSGIVTIKTMAAAGTWNFNLPIDAGVSGKPLVSFGGGTNQTQWTTLGVGGGGTGLAGCSQGDFPYCSITNTFSLLPKNVSATRYLSNTGTNNNPAWAQVNLTNGVTGALPATQGGIPVGGSAGQVLAKNTTTDYDTVWTTPTSSAPIGAEYITSTADATLTAERVLTDTATVTWDRTTAGQIKANAAGGTSTTISDTPPGSPTAGSMWWESDSGTLWIYYNDGNTSQWVAAGAGASTSSSMVLLQTKTISAAVANVDFTSFINDVQFDEYEIHVVGPIPSANDALVMKVSTDNGSTFRGGTEYQAGLCRVNASGAVAGGGSTGAPFVPFMAVNQVAALGNGQNNFIVRLFQPSMTGNWKGIMLDGVMHEAGTGLTRISGHGYWIGTAAINSVRFQWSVGSNFTAGTFKLFGIRKS